MKAMREYLEEREKENLAPWACSSSMSRGRVYEEKAHHYRTEFQRDRERIIHSRAFRRLEYKTQVFINHEGDHYRTRLTHTIEVAQIARTIARALRLNEDLAEAIALAHDLGHTPFGHAGERELNELLKDHGGFEHNRQSLRVVDTLEQNYPAFSGLNLTWETREGIIKHSSQYDIPDYSDFEPESLPSLEAQIIDLADEIAYNNHDLDDGLASGILDIREVSKLELWQMAEGMGTDPAPEKVHNRAVIRNIINILASDLIETLSSNIEEAHITTFEDIKQSKNKLTSFSADIGRANLELKTFLRNKLYRHFRVTRMTLKAQKVVRELFDIFTSSPETLPERYRLLADKEGVIHTAADYIAGMTDRYAMEEYSKLTDPAIKV
jgi:dGTPase